MRRRGPQFEEPLAASLGRAGQPFDRHGGRTYEDTLDDLVAEGYRFIEVRGLLRTAHWNGIRDSIECIPDDLPVARGQCEDRLLVDDQHGA